MDQLRIIGKQSLSTVLNNNSNVQVFEKVIYNASVAESKRNGQDVEAIYRRFVYQTIGDITLKDKKLKTIISNIKNSMIGWGHIYYTDISKKMEEHDNYLENPFELVEGIAECKNCGCNKVFSYSKQIRSADEPETVFYTCATCRSKWIYSG